MKFRSLKFRHFVSVDDSEYHVVYSKQAGGWASYRSDVQGGLRRLSGSIWKTAEAGFNECRKYRLSVERRE